MPPLIPTELDVDTEASTVRVTPVFPDGLSQELRLVRERRFDNGMVQVGYEVRHPRSRG